MGNIPTDSTVGQHGERVIWSSGAVRAAVGREGSSGTVRAAVGQRGQQWGSQGSQGSSGAVRAAVVSSDRQ